MSDSTETPLNPCPIGPDDDEIDRQLKTALQDLVNGGVESTTAAKIVDNLIVSDCQRAYEAHSASLRSNNKPKENGEYTETFSKPPGWAGYLWRAIGKAAIAVPHNHRGQDHLVSFLQELPHLPPRTFQYISGSGDLVDYTFWEDDRRNDQFCQNMRLLDTEYVNFSAFLARVFARGVVDTTRFCALVTKEFLGLYWPYNKQAYRSEPYVLAAAQWMTHAGAAMWEMCEKKAYAAKGFNPKWWGWWQARFAQVAEDDSGFSEQAREASAEALKQMAVLKEDGCAGLSVIEAFGLNVKDWEGEE
ncbi:uncharacterized protein PG986_002531 [Apiospora aurea]|uniref:Uncharacterized protein n=1 Tax=Apiospora aurea TaxID=335848 RepID=A0ABR1QQP6_9PEZI